MSKKRYALWVHAIDNEGESTTHGVVRFWNYDSKAEAGRELLKAAVDEAVKPGVAILHYNIRHEDQDRPFTRGTLHSDTERRLRKEKHANLSGS